MNTACGYKTDVIKGLVDVINHQFETYSIDPLFPESVENLKEENLYAAPCDDRRDFRAESVLTIDGSDCKDMDDAISLSRNAFGYRLTVHIADVAAYVPVGSELDQAAVSRATSIYLPGFTVPMLPQVLSNNLCSLNPGVDRNTLSVIAYLDTRGKLIDSEITKGLIRSRVKGVYSEVNRLLSGAPDERLQRKYSQVKDELFNMAELYELLRAERIKRGATVKDSNKPKITINHRGVTIRPTKEGVAENLIEEFMCLANRIVSEYLFEHNLPAIFRIQEEKNHMAAYRPVRNHHAELALESYTHFTSPIRRIADLKIHQILTMHLAGAANDEIKTLFDTPLIDICDRATKRYRTARQVQEKCERYCYEHFFRSHRGDTYTGMLVGFDRKNRPIVQISDYNIKIIGYAIIDGKIGDRYAFKVGINDMKNEMFASRAQRLAA